MGNNIKGITVDIGGNVGPLASALQEVNTPINKLQSELKEVNRQLKFDPSNTTLLKQKQDLLAQSADALKDKQTILKKAVTDAQAQFEKGNFGADKVRAVEREYEKVTSQLKDVQKQQLDVGASVGTLGDKIKSSFSNMGQSIKSAFSLENVKAGIGAVGAAVGVFLKGSIGEAQDAEKANADLAQTLKSTGGASGMTMQSINSLTEAMVKNTTFSDDEIKSGEGMLLTFTNIGKNVFPQATAALLDMSQKMGTAPKDAAVQLGKALNDPVKGITALTRVGVTFADQQKDQITQMVKTGDMAGAQKVILGELNKEFGGQAAAAADTYAGKQKQLQNTMKEMQETIGTALIPMLSKLLQAAMPIIQTVAKFVTEHPQLTAAILAVIAVVGILIGGLSLLTTVTGAFGITLDVALLPTIGLVVLAIAGIAVAAVAIVTHWKDISGFFIGLWNGIKAVFAGIGAWFASVFNGAVNGVKAVWNGVTGFFTGIWNGIKTVFMVVGAWFAGIFSGAVNGIKTAFGAVVGFFSGIGNGIRSAITSTFKFISDFFNAFAEGWSNGFVKMQTAPETVAAAIAEIFNDVFTFLKNIFVGIGSAAAAPFKEIITAVNQVYSGIKQVFSGIVTLLKDIFIGPILLLFDALVEIFTGNWTKMHQDATKLLTQMSGAIHAILQGLYNVFVGIFNSIKSVVLTVVTAISAIPGAVFNAMVIFVRAILTAFGDEINAIWTSIKNAALAVWSAMLTGVQTFLSQSLAIFQAVGNAIMSAWSAVVSFFWNLPGNIGNAMAAIGSAIRSVWDAIIGFFESLPNTIGNIMNSIGSWIRNAWDGLVDFVAGIPGKFMAGLSGLGNAVRSGFQDAISFITGLPDEALKWGGDIINGIVNGIKNAAGAVGKAVQGVAQDIRSFLHFSEPDTGPLVGFHGWWKDMMYGMAEDINSNITPVADAARRVASTVAGNIGNSMSLISTPASALSAARNTSYSATSVTNNNTKAPVINVNGPVNVTDQGNQRQTLQQLQFLAEI